MLIRLALAAMLLLAGLTPAGAQTPLRASDLAREFEEVGFLARGETSDAPAQRRFIRPLQPMPISITKNKELGAGGNLAGIVEEVAATLRKGAGVDIEVKIRRQQFDVVGLREDEFVATAARLGELDPSYMTAFGFAQFMKRDGCYFFFVTQDDAQLMGGRVMVDLEGSAERQSACVYRGILYLMGLEGDTLAPTGVFTDVRRVRGLTARDLAIVRMSLDRRLKPGMTLAEARPLLPAIAADALAR